MTLRHALLLLAAMSMSACGDRAAEPASVEESPQSTGSAGPVLVYDMRGAAAARELLEAYRAETGNRYVIVQDGAGAAPPKADLYLVGGLDGLWSMAETDQLRPVFSRVIDNNIPPQLRDSESRWTGLSVSGQFVVYNTQLVDAAELATVTGYDSLGGASWRGRLCLSSSGNSANRVLVAFLIRDRGARSAEIVVREWVANLALPPLATDAELLAAIAEGRCAIGIAGSNAVAGFVSGKPSPPLETHRFAEPRSMLVDISGAGVSRHAANPDGASALLEWLTTSVPNALHAAIGREAAANPGAPVTDDGSWYDPAARDQPVSELGFLLEDAARLVERARYP